MIELDEHNEAESVYHGWPWLYCVIHKQDGMRMIQCSMLYLLSLRITAVIMGAMGTTLSLGLGIRRCELSGAFIIWEKDHGHMRH